jgi:hypothetical protein
MTTDVLSPNEHSSFGAGVAATIHRIVASSSSAGADYDN